MPEAVDRVVVHHPHRLHERVADRRAHESEPAPLEILAQRIRLWRAGGDLAERTPAIHLRRPTHELPCVAIEAAELPLHIEECLRVRYRALDLAAVSDDSGIREDPIDPCRREARNGRRVEFGEDAPVVLPLLQDRRPAETRLGTFEREKLEQHAVIVDGHAPLGIVVGDVEVRPWPSAALRGTYHLGNHTSNASHRRLTCCMRSMKRESRRKSPYNVSIVDRTG